MEHNRQETFARDNHSSSISGKINDGANYFGDKPCIKFKHLIDYYLTSGHLFGEVLQSFDHKIILKTLQTKNID